MLSVRSFYSSGADFSALSTQIKATTPHTADLCFVFGNVTLLERFAQQTDLLSSSKKWLGGSSCLGVGADLGMDLEQGSLTLLQINDPRGAYGVAAGMMPLTDIEQQASRLVQQAMTDAGRAAQTPDLVWCFQAPGQEEAVLSGIRAVVGKHVPIFGGSAADDTLNGDWKLFDGHNMATDLLVIAVLYPSAPLYGYFSAGYTLTRCSGKVTAATSREILAIDHQPAAQVYLAWSQLEKEQSVDKQMILAQSALQPLGRIINQIEGIPLTLLSHPVYINQADGLGLFTEISVGDDIWMLRGDADQLVRRAAQVVAVSRDALSEQDVNPVGALIVFCAGCMLAVRGQMADVRAAIAAEIPGLPFTMVFTYGEQGCFADGQSRHGNLMISAVFFGSTDA